MNMNKLLTATNLSLASVIALAKSFNIQDLTKIYGYSNEEYQSMLENEYSNFDYFKGKHNSIKSNAEYWIGSLDNNNLNNLINFIQGK